MDQFATLAVVQVRSDVLIDSDIDACDPLMLACQHQDPGDFDGHAFGGFDQSSSSAARAILVDAPFEAWSDPLSRHFDQTERTGSEDFGSGPIAFHRIA